MQGGNKYMWIFVFFDLPTTTKKDRKHATAFRKWLLKEGYIMLQWSVYARLCNGLDRAQKHMDRISPIVPPKGSVRSLIITDKQYASMRLLVGDFTDNEKPIKKAKNIQLSLF